ncbi:MAG: recombinase family protein [Synergistaceae bacterium]|nr:recombinase family protein [Synergistaceae bacterium]
MLYGYARVSTYGQARDGNSLDFQIQALRNAGAIQIFSDVFSGSKNYRPQLDHLLNIIQTGDTIIITKLDRIARSLVHGIQLLEYLSNKGVIIDVLNMGIIDDSPTGKLIRNIMLAFSEFERDMIIQRTQEGKAVARQNPNFHDGRPKKFSRTQIKHALELLQTHSYQQVADMTGISRATLARAKAELKQLENS